MKILAKKEEIVQARIKKSFTGADVAKRAGISKRGYYNIEAGEHGANPATANKICKALEVEFDQIFEVEGD